MQIILWKLVIFKYDLNSFSIQTEKEKMALNSDGDETMHSGVRNIKYIYRME